MASQSPTSPRPRRVHARASGRRAWIWVVYTGLYGLSIPWYFTPGDPPAIWLGLPHWVVLSLLATAAIAGFTALVVSRHWPEPDDDWDLGPPPHGGETSAGSGTGQAPR
jgi:hypothetical protein